MANTKIEARGKIEAALGRPIVGEAKIQQADYEVALNFILKENLPLTDDGIAYIPGETKWDHVLKRIDLPML